MVYAIAAVDNSQGRRSGCRVGILSGETHVHLDEEFGGVWYRPQWPGR